MLLIAEVERATGIGKDTLRIWERRYGFPNPHRNEFGQRCYPIDQVDKLLLIRRLTDFGIRPMQLAPLMLEELEELIKITTQNASQAEGTQISTSAAVHDLLPLLERNSLKEFQTSLKRQLAIHGFDAFVCQSVAPLTSAVGEAWANGQISVFQEHQYTECIENILRAAITELQNYHDHSGLDVLLATFPNELHSIGLLMAECVFLAAGARCLSLGVHTPIAEIVAAAEAYQPQIIALSFSSQFNHRVGHRGISELRMAVPMRTSIWIGGSARFLNKIRIAGIQVVQNLESVRSKLSTALEPP